MTTNQPLMCEVFCACHTSSDTAKKKDAPCETHNCQHCETRKRVVMISNVPFCDVKIVISRIVIAMQMCMFLEVPSGTGMAYPSDV